MLNQFTDMSVFAVAAAPLGPSMVHFSISPDFVVDSPPGLSSISTSASVSADSIVVVVPAASKEGSHNGFPLLQTTSH